MYLFGFGSLINLESIQKSFVRKLSQGDLVPCKINAYKKVWNSVEFISFDGEKINGVFLNLQKDENASALGVKIKITPEELKFLKLREKNYSCIQLDDDTVTFITTKKDKLAKIGDKDTFIPSKYIDLLLKGLENYEEDFKNEYIKETFSKLPFDTKDGVYTFCDPIQNKFAKEGIKKDENK